MENQIQEFVKKRKNLFGENPIVEKVNVGFTNTIYSINDEYILKICTNMDNEENFQKEINFYLKNKNNSYIPKLIEESTEKKELPYNYEILEKVEGVSLFHIWHKLKESEREDIIRQLSVALKEFHKEKGKPYDWCEYQKQIFQEAYQKALENGSLTSEQSDIIEDAYARFDEFLGENKDFSFLHNDLHFDNIFYHNGTIKIIDFERAIFAPLDFELDIIYRMTRKPWKYASEETEPYTKYEDYQTIMPYLKKYDEELFTHPYLKQRLDIYDMVYYMRNLVEYPKNEELKEDIINASKRLLGGLQNEKNDYRR
ncbi:MAG: aminoglycoside phosphotransferase family protein [Bacilli bacterium]|nr:aminoglycoside phosphotransferase family protein [Bacilli bacterium]